MKSIVICLVLLAGSHLAGISQQDTIISPAIERSIPITPFDQLTIDGNVNLTLSEGEEPSIQIHGDPKFIQDFKVSQSRNRLLIKSPYVVNNANNEVKICVKNLKKLIVLAQSVITTKGILQSEKLNILIHAECFITIKNSGITTIDASDGLDLEIGK